jgi:hypothetical protein
MEYYHTSPSLQTAEVQRGQLFIQRTADSTRLEQPGCKVILFPLSLYLL